MVVTEDSIIKPVDQQTQLYLDSLPKKPRHKERQNRLTQEQIQFAVSRAEETSSTVTSNYNPVH